MRARWRSPQSISILSPVKEGQAITAMWRGKPIFIRNRTKPEIELAVNVDVKNLPDALRAQRRFAGR